MVECGVAECSMSLAFFVLESTPGRTEKNILFWSWSQRKTSDYVSRPGARKRGHNAVKNKNLNI